MDGMETVVDAPEIESGGGGEPEGGSEPQQSTQPENPFEPKSSKAYADWLKTIRDADPNNVKYARQAKDNFSRLYELSQLDKDGVAGVREKYALLDSVVHGELKGIEAIGAIQDELRQIDEIDSRLIQGDPAALDELGDDFLPGLAKLAPEILSRVQAHDPEAYANAVLPHFVEALRGSDLVRHFNGLVDTLNEAPPSWLTADQKAHWQAEQQQKVIRAASGMAQWFKAQDDKVKGLKTGTPNVPRGTNGTAKQSGQPSEQQKWEKERNEHHWKTQIQPGLDKHAQSKFTELFRPYAQRLKLDPTATKSLQQAFTQGVVRKAGANPAYMSQIQRYHGQKLPDPSTVVNFAKVEFDRHAKSVMEGLVKERYSGFLNGVKKPVASNGSGNGAASQNRAPVSPGVQIVSVKPPMNEIDHKRTPLDWIHQGKYRLTNGKVVQVRR